MTQADPVRTVRIGDADLAVEVRRAPRARRITLRVDAATRRVILTLPPGVDPARGFAFLREKQLWLQNRVARMPQAVAFADGAVIPFLGEDHVIRHRPDARGGVWREDGALHVTGDPAHLPRRLQDWLKAEARRELSAQTRAMAARVDRPVARVSVRDTRSRWGSCTSAGALSFSWRLVFAPRHVFDYVVAHEVAHLVELNHGPRFWRLVEDLCSDMDRGRAWLKRHGARLHGYGAADGAQAGTTSSG
ncbi:MAG: SprT family zinc-dependent metalloprotease [Bauldia litoralis]